MTNRCLLAALSASAVLWWSACADESGKREPAWQVVQQDLPGALLSVWGSAADDVWAVGGDAADGDGPMVLHFDGKDWTRQPTGTSGDLWWVHGFAGGPVFMAGAEGRILRYAQGAFELLETPGTNTVYGLWGAAPDDVWAVGGAGSTPSGGFIWRFDGQTWREAEGVPAELASSATVFKVWGRSRSDVWFVGTDGLVMHHDGERFERVESGSSRTLFTVHGDSERTLAVGGYVDGLVLEQLGGGFEDVTPQRAPQFAGVYASPQGAFAVGIAGSVYSDAGGVFDRVETGLSLSEDLHAVWVDPQGGVWCVGGRLASAPLVKGILMHREAPEKGSEHR